MTWCDSGIFWDLPLDWPARLGSEMGRAGPVGHTFQGVSVGRVPELPFSARPGVRLADLHQA